MKRMGTLQVVFLSLLVSYEWFMKGQQQGFFNVVVAFTPVMMKPKTTRTKTTRTTTFAPFTDTRTFITTTKATHTIFNTQNFDSSTNLLLHTATTLDAVETLHNDEKQHEFDDAMVIESKTESMVLGTNKPPSMKQPKPMLMMQKMQGMMMMMKSTTNGLFLHGDDADDAADVWEKKVSWITSIVLAMTLMMATTFSSPDMAIAAMSGGRMGGSFSPSTPTMKSSSSYRPNSSYSGGGGGGGARRSSSFSAYNNHYYYGGGGRRTTFANPSAYYSRTMITSPTIITSPAVPYYVTPTPSVYSSGGDGWFVNALSLFALTTFVGGSALIDKFTSSLSSASSTLFKSNEDDEMTRVSSGSSSSALGTGTSVLQASVALQVSDRTDPNSILNVLSRLSETSKTDTRVGIQQLTKEVALQILRKKSTIISAYTRYKHFGQFKHAERDYNQLSVRERAKFEQETISKYNGVDYNSSNNKITGKKKKNPTLAVVTILLALEGDSTKIPKITSIHDVQKSLEMIASDAMVEDCLLSAEILWTPENHEETLTVGDVATDYPELTPV